MTISTELNRPTTSQLDLMSVSAKRYCILRHKQEKDFKSFKEPLDNELADLMQDLLEECISKRNITNNRVIVEKSIQSSDFITTDKELSNAEMVDAIYSGILNNFNNNIRVSSAKHLYIDGEEVIKKYLLRYYEIKDNVDVFKQAQREALNHLTAIIVEQGVAKNILVYSFKRLKADLYARNSEGANDIAIDVYDDIYNKVKDELIGVCK